jgi:hypothetical protein
LSDVEFGKNPANLSSQFATSANRRSEFQKRSQLFIRAYNETLSVVAMCVPDKDRSPFGFHSVDAAPTPTGFTEIVCDDLLHAQRIPARLLH